MGRGRPGGNPRLRKFAYEKNADNPTDKPMEVLSVRLEARLVEKIKSGDNWLENFRAKLREVYTDVD